MALAISNATNGRKARSMRLFLKGKGVKILEYIKVQVIALLVEGNVLIGEK